jgi:hypothetical protein
MKPVNAAAARLQAALSECFALYANEELVPALCSGRRRRQRTGSVLGVLTHRCIKKDRC